jgi:Mn2+/Fe2+ NRAMP family transporter
MTILLIIIALHMMAILAGRNIRNFDYTGIAVLITVTVLLVAAVLYVMFTMKIPDVGNV